MLKYQRIKKPARRPSPHLGHKNRQTERWHEMPTGKNRFFVLRDDGHIQIAVYRLPRCDDF